MKIISLPRTFTFHAPAKRRGHRFSVREISVRSRVVMSLTTPAYSGLSERKGVRNRFGIGS